MAIIPRVLKSMLDMAAPTFPVMEINIKKLSPTNIIDDIAPNATVSAFDFLSSEISFGINGITETGIATVVSAIIERVEKFGAYFCIRTSHTAYEAQAQSARKTVKRNFCLPGFPFDFPIRKTAAQHIVPAKIIELGSFACNMMFENIKTKSIFTPIIGVIRLTSPRSAQMKVARFPAAQNTPASRGCHIIEISGRAGAKNI